MSRRQLLKGLVAGAGAAAGPSIVRVGRTAPPPLLEDDRLPVLCAAAERVLPGVGQAGFRDFCLFWLAREPFSRAADWRPLLVAGAAHLDRLAHQRYGRNFVDLDAEQQDRLLGEFQQGKVSARKFRSEVFFQRLVLLALESFFGDPKYGGNREQAGWNFAGHRGCWWAPRKPTGH